MPDEVLLIPRGVRSVWPRADPTNELSKDRVCAGTAESRRSRPAEYSAMLENINIGLGNASRMAGFPFCCCSAETVEGTADMVEECIALRANNWQAKYGVQTAVVRGVQWLSPTMPNYDWSALDEASMWNWYALTFTPPDALEAPGHALDAPIIGKEPYYPNRSVSGAEMFAQL